MVCSTDGGCKVKNQSPCVQAVFCVFCRLVEGYTPGPCSVTCTRCFTSSYWVYLGPLAWKMWFMHRWLLEFCTASRMSDLFLMGFGLNQGCSLSQILLILYHLKTVSFFLFIYFLDNVVLFGFIEQRQPKITSPSMKMFWSLIWCSSWACCIKNGKVFCSR